MNKLLITDRVIEKIHCQNEGDPSDMPVIVLYKYMKEAVIEDHIEKGSTLKPCEIYEIMNTEGIEVLEPYCPNPEPEKSPPLPPPPIHKRKNSFPQGM